MYAPPTSTIKPHVIVVDSNEGKLSPHSSYQDQVSPGLEGQYKEEGCQTEIQLIEPLFNILNKAKK